MRNIILVTLILTMPAPAWSGAAAPSQGVVYWGNSKTGKAVRVINKPNASALAKAEVEKIGGDGWKEYENSPLSGVGAAICVASSRGGERQVYFFTSHGQIDAKTAAKAARAKAASTARELKETTYACDKPFWVVQQILPENYNRPDPTLLDPAKRLTRKIIEAIPSEPCTPYKPNYQLAQEQGLKEGEPIKRPENMCPPPKSNTVHTVRG